MIGPDARREIATRLARAEAEHDVRILFASESGSRAWGFASEDSDYDVRFVYVPRYEWYLSTQSQRDVIEYPIVDDFDVSGWELAKALRLFRKSNPPLLEWLRSPHVYVDRGTLSRRLLELAERHASPRALRAHYLSMARSNRREWLSGETVRQKKYLYVLRALLAARWVERDLGLVPMEFQHLVEATLGAPGEAAAREAILRLVESKRGGTELGQGARIDVLSRFIETEVERAEGLEGPAPVDGAPWAALNDVLRSILRETWGSFT